MPYWRGGTEQSAKSPATVKDKKGKGFPYTIPITERWARS